VIWRGPSLRLHREAAATYSILASRPIGGDAGDARRICDRRFRTGDTSVTTRYPVWQGLIVNDWCQY
jgi:hypothetical protein